MGSTNAGTGLHGDHALQCHGHVDQHAVTFLDAIGLQRVGKLADACQQLFVGGFGDGSIIGFKDDRCLVFRRGAHVFVETVCRNIELAVVKPFVKRCVGLIQRAGKGLVPDHVFTGQFRPEALKIAFGLRAQCVVAVHARDAGIFHHAVAG